MQVLYHQQGLSETPEAEKGKILKELEEVKVEELEVIGAFVTFTHVPGLERFLLHIKRAVYVVL